MHEHFFAPAYVRLLYQFLRAEGISGSLLLEGTGVSEETLMRAGYEMTFPDQMQLCQNGLRHAAPGVGLRVGHQLQLAAHGVLGVAMQTAPNLAAALEAFAEFLSVRASFFQLSQAQVDGRVVVTIRTEGLPEGLVPFFSESILHSLAHCLSFYSGSGQASGGLQLAYPPPAYSGHYRDVFGGTVRFNRPETTFAFAASLLSLPSPEADVALFTDSVERCKRLVGAHFLNIPHGDVATEIEHFLLENPGKLWTLSEIAQLLAISERTLIRRLRAVNTTYQSLRDDVLKRQAAIFIKSMSADATAVALGFADASSFRRTFKRWFDETPSAHRARRATPSR